MQSDVVLSAAHWAYLISVLVIIITMIFRANVVVPSVIGTLAVVTAMTGSPIQGFISIFSASFVAAQELFNIFLVITFMTALLNSLKRLEADVKMVAPFRKVMVNSASSFLMIAAATYFYFPVLLAHTCCTSGVGHFCCRRRLLLACLPWSGRWLSPSVGRAWRYRPTTSLALLLASAPRQPVSEPMLPCWRIVRWCFPGLPVALR